MKFACPLSPLISNIVLETLAGAISQDKETTIQTGKERLKLSLFVFGIILYIRLSKYSIRKLLESAMCLNIESTCKNQ